MARPLKPGRGLTLVETLLVMVLGVALLTILYSILAQVFGIYGRSQARAALQDDALIALSRLMEEIRVTTLASLTVSDQPPALCYGVPDTTGTFTGSAELLPLFTVCWWDPAKHQLRWKQWPAATEPVVLKPNPFNSGRRLTAAEITLIISQLNGTERILAENVQSLVVAPARFPSLTPVDSFSLQLTLSRPWGADSLSQTANLTVMPRNESAVLAPSTGTP